MKRNAADVIDQFAKAGLVHYIHPGSVEVNEHSISGRLYSDVLPVLRSHEQFKEGIFHGLHPDVGEDRTEFRSYRKAFGDGSLQIVIDRQTGKFYADIDNFSVYEDVVGIVGHLFGEVVPNAVKRWFRRG